MKSDHGPIPVLWTSLIQAIYFTYENILESSYFTDV